jgi:hypothetical protein
VNGEFKSWNSVTLRSNRYLFLHEVTESHIFREYKLSMPHTSTNSRDSSAGIALGYGLDDRGSRVRFPAGAGSCSLHHRVQNGSGAHAASYPMGTRGSFPGSKAAGPWNSPLTCTYCRGQRMRGAIPPLPQYAFMAWCLVKHRDNFTFLPLFHTSATSVITAKNNSTIVKIKLPRTNME